MLESIKEFLEYVECNYSEKNAFQYYDTKEDQIIQITYKLYVEDVKKCASYYLKKYEDIHKMHVGIMANNTYECIVNYVAVMLVGAVPVLLNTQEKWNIIQYELEKARIKLVLSDGQYEKREPQLLEQNEILLEKTTLHREQQLCEMSAMQALSGEETITMIFTSGTTGKNKAVQLSFQNIWGLLQYNDEKVAELRELFFEEIPVLLVVPLYHVSGLNLLYVFGYEGECLNLCPNAKFIYRDLQKMKSVYATLPPIFLEMFCKDIQQGRREKLGDLKVIVSGGAALNHEMLQTFDKEGMVVVDAYGMTETTGVGAMSKVIEPNEEKRLHSVGVCGRENSIQIVDGEICIQGATVSKGYYNEDSIEDFFDVNGWFHTGDLGYMDEEGYLYIVGRKKNLIILSNGENVVPEELEERLLKNENVLECLVKEIDKKIGCEIYCNKGEEEEIQGYIDSINREMALYKRINITVFRDTPFERNQSGKIIRR